MRELWYLATAYSKDPEGITHAFDLAVRTRGMLIKAGIPVFSPIVHSHPVAVVCNIDPFDHSFWLASEEPILESATGLIMLMSSGWAQSYGMNKEFEAFRAAGKPVIYMEPGIIPPELVKTIY